MTRGKPAARGCDHPTYPEFEEEFGEDPARYLYHLNPQPRIRGIRDSGLLRAYLSVEGDRDSPRRHIIAACNERLKDISVEATGGAQPEAVVTDGGEQQ